MRPDAIRVCDDKSLPIRNFVKSGGALHLFPVSTRPVKHQDQGRRTRGINILADMQNKDSVQCSAMDRLCS